MKKKITLFTFLFLSQFLLAQKNLELSDLLSLVTMKDYSAISKYDLKIDEIIDYDDFKKIRYKTKFHNNDATLVINNENSKISSYTLSLTNEENLRYWILDNIQMNYGSVKRTKTFSIKKEGLEVKSFINFEDFQKYLEDKKLEHGEEYSCLYNVALVNIRLELSKDKYIIYISTTNID